MDDIVRRITVIHTDSKTSSAEVIYEKGAKSRKTSRALRPVEKLHRRVLKAQKSFADEALALHDKHARKRKNGWLRDAPVIVFKANRKALKKLTSW